MLTHSKKLRNLVFLRKRDRRNSYLWLLIYLNIFGLKTICFILFSKKRRNIIRKLKEILSLFANGLSSIHEDMLKFFTKYSKGVIDSNFHREYERLFDAFNKRIEYEENILYGEYDKTDQ